VSRCFRRRTRAPGGAHRPGAPTPVQPFGPSRSVPGEREAGTLPDASCKSGSPAVQNQAPETEEVPPVLARHAEPRPVSSLPSAGWELDTERYTPESPSLGPPEERKIVSIPVISYKALRPLQQTAWTFSVQAGWLLERSARRAQLKKTASPESLLVPDNAIPKNNRKRHDGERQKLLPSVPLVRKPEGGTPWEMETYGADSPPSPSFNNWRR